MHYSKPSDISNNIVEPDRLFIKFTRPNVIIDKESGEPLDLENSTFLMLLQRQFTEEQYEDLLEAAKTAATVGSSITFGQLILLLFIGKAINAMWLLILTAQFIVIISKWSINFNDLTRTFFSELQRIVFAEYFDQYETGKKVQRFLGIPVEDGNEVDDKIGADRFGSENVFENFGPTFFIFLGIIILLSIIVLATYCICRRSERFSEKNKECSEKLKKKIFFNPFIKYSYLNALKVYMSSCLVFLQFEESSVGQKAVAIFILLVISLLPILYARIMFKNKKNL